MKQEIRFCRSADGAGLAFALTGSGMPLVRTQHWVTHLEWDFRSPVSEPILSELSARFRLLRYDQRGCGLSDADPADISFEAWVADLEAVVDAAGFTQFALYGPSQGSAIAIAYAARHPERVTQLVLLGGYSRGWNRRGSPAIVERAEALARLIEVGWGTQEATFRQVFTSAFMPGATLEQQRFFNDMMRVSTSPETAARVFRAFGQIDVDEEVRRVACPCLIAHARGDLRVPFEEGRRLAGLIAGARFLPLESDNHVLIRGEPAWQAFFEAVDGFLPSRKGGGEFPMLTQRERDVLDLVAQGLDNAQVAARLDLSEKTVRNHITHIFDKIEVENRSQAIVLARKAGLGAEPGQP